MVVYTTASFKNPRVDNTINHMPARITREFVPRPIIYTLNLHGKYAMHNAGTHHHRDLVAGREVEELHVKSPPVNVLQVKIKWVDGAYIQEEVIVRFTSSKHASNS